MRAAFACFRAVKVALFCLSVHLLRIRYINGRVDSLTLAGDCRVGCVSHRPPEILARWATLQLAPVKISHTFDISSLQKY